MEKLAADTHMGTVDLLVRDLETMVAYYREGIGLDVLAETGGTITLGRATPGGGEAIVRLNRNADLPTFHRRDVGLFHTAILFDTQAALASAVLSTARHDGSSFTGSADHLVSEAFYFDDPEGNGIELYYDRPRDQWVSMGGGQIKMATLPLDPGDYLSSHLPRPGVGAGTGSDGATVGHVHLQVGDIGQAEAFYSGVLGFEVTARHREQALFIAAGGYHHHIGLNTWNSHGAGPRAASLGLERVEIEVPDADELSRIRARLTDAGLESELRTDEAGAGTRLITADPWKTRIEIATTLN